MKTIAPVLIAFFVFLLCGCSLCGRVDPVSPQTLRYVKLNIASLPDPADRVLKVVSYNIALCRKVRGAGNLLRENKDLAGADVICLQEMCPEGVEYLAGYLQCNYVYYPSAVHPGTGKEFGPAIISRWPMENEFKVILPLTDKDRFIKLPRCATAAYVLFGGRRILVFSVHLGVRITPRERQEQLKAVVASIPAPAGECVIAGDFNTYTGAHNTAIDKTLTDAGFEDASKHAGWTYKYWYLFNKKAKLDHIFIRGMNVKGSGRVLDRRFSDHLPLWAEFE